jgi:NAD(P)-dependent dehydrogenase (short-subunit alcohol dehydrogenase family)
MDLQLKDKVAVITGGNTGIGLALGHAFGREGAHVALLARNAEKLAAGVAEISQRWGTRAIGLPCDVTQPDQINAAVAQIEAEFNEADVLVNNAGEGTGETIMDAPDEKWQYYWDLHVMAAIRLARSLVPAMRRRRGGAILHNASICATQPMFNEPIYNVTKAALVMLSKCMAEEFIRDNIRVNVVNPGLIQTAPWEAYAQKLAAEHGTTPAVELEGIARGYAPIGRFATPQELADFMLFLCSPVASYCVGGTYYIDGGWLRVIT